MTETAFFTVEEVAARLRVSTETVRRWCRDDIIRCVRMGRQFRIPAEVAADLEANGLPARKVAEPKSDAPVSLAGGRVHPGNAEGEAPRGDAPASSPGERSARPFAQVRVIG